MYQNASIIIGIRTVRMMIISEGVENICIADACITDNILYAAGFEWNLLFKFDMRSMEVKKLGEFTKFKNPYSFQNRAIFKFKDSLFCVSINSYEIAEYNMKKREISYFDIEDNWANKGKLLVKSVCRVDDEIWIFQEAINEFVVVFSMETRSYLQYKIKIEGIINRYNHLDWESSVCVGTLIWRCIPGSSDLLLLDTKSKRAQVINTKLPLSFFDINYDNGYLYIVTSDGKNYVAFNVATFKVDTYESDYVGIPEYPFIDAVRINDYLYSLPCFEECIFRYKIEGRKLRLIQRIQLPEEFKKVHDAENRSLFYKWKKIGHKLFLLPFSGNGMLCLDSYSLDITFYPIKISEKDYLSWVLKNSPMQNEGKMNLKDFLRGLICGLDTETDDIHKGVNKGESIWKFLQ